MEGACIHAKASGHSAAGWAHGFGNRRLFRHYAAIYAVVGRFTTAVLLGGLLGTVIAVGNFLALSITVSNALDRAAAGDNSVKACMSIQSSSVVRTAILAVIYVLLFHAKVCDPLAALLPLLFAQAAIKLIEFFRKDSKGGDAVP